MKPTVECKRNCIAVRTKHQTEILYDTDLKQMMDKYESCSEYCDAVYDYFAEAFEDEELSYKDIIGAAKKVYRNLKE